MSVSLEWLIKNANKRLNKKGMRLDTASKTRNVIKKMHAQGIYVGIAQGYRSIAEQNKLYAQGRTKKGAIVTNAKGGQSNHNFGCAVDLFIYSSNGKSVAAWNPPSSVIKAMKAEGFEWGGDWKGFVDKPHFELYDAAGGEKMPADRNYEVVVNPNAISAKVQDVAPLLPKPKFKGQTPIRLWKSGAKIQVRKHSRYWYKTSVKVKNKWITGYIYHSFLRDVKQIKGTDKYSATIKSFAIFWDNENLSGGKILTYKPGTKLSHYPAKNGLKSAYFSKQKKVFYTTTYFLK
ncbi:M15 family metallopeptidase [Listeria goaensis]|uniref:M15 family metallopeptidase n=1 Tax=Listeria goaensis TaxID=1649188 RepID=UPI000B590124|nr:M15 family metallopeptidase [Listeria goaensis]